MITLIVLAAIALVAILMLIALAVCRASGDSDAAYSQSFAAHIAPHK